MRRADRLFQLVQVLRARRFATGQQIADELGVSKRTVYRDIADLQGSGVPIEGEAGVGYRIDRGFELPPLTFNAEEIGVLVVGTAGVTAGADSANPGDLLYPVDRSVEQVGSWLGLRQDSVAERAAEASVLLGRGDVVQAAQVEGGALARIVGGDFGPFLVDPLAPVRRVRRHRIEAPPHRPKRARARPTAAP
ncbi:MAG: HTH domain-containing protein [Proteobacteria bacterium]|nr:HTH domain-containing protein [Pseudomonadota bacterium]